MRLYRSILPNTLLIAAVVFAASALADRIHSAAESLNSAVISNILQDDPSQVNLKDTQGRTPLLCALNGIYFDNGGGLKKTINLLVVVYHADIGVRDKDGNTVVHCAVRDGVDIVKMFVQLRGNLVTATNNFQETPLHTAVRSGQLDIAEFLLASGAHVNARDKDGVTPLHIAVEKRNTPMVNLLLQYHADINARTKAGQTPYTLAKDDNDSTFQRFIRKNGGLE